MIEFVPATADHVKALYADPPPRTLRAIVAVDGDRVLGIGGLYEDQGQSVAFAKLTDELRANKRAVIQGARRVMRLFGRRVFALCDTAIPDARSFLEHFGFNNVTGEVYVWQA